MVRAIVCAGVLLATDCHGFPVGWTYAISKSVCGADKQYIVDDAAVQSRQVRWVFDLFEGHGSVIVADVDF
jgi:hypothetical protein